jgi:small ligand-binding sensory domain FIST
MNVKANPVQQSIGGRKRGSLGAIQIGTKVEAGRHRQFHHRDVTGERGTRGASYKMQIGIRSGTDAGRVT